MSLSHLRIQTKVIALILPVLGFIAFNLVTNAQPTLALHTEGLQSVMSTPIAYAQAGVVVNGQCGSENLATVATQPTGSRACATGSIASMQSTGSGWTWVCNGSGGGVDTVALAGVGTTLSVNIIPTVTAGSDLSVILPTNSVDVGDAMADDVDGSIMLISWSKLPGSPAGGNITNGNSLSPTFNNLVEGVYTFRLNVVDNQRGSNADSIEVRVMRPISPTLPVSPTLPNIPPVADAGGDRFINQPVNATAPDGARVTDSNSLDPWRMNAPAIASISWSQVSGPTAAGITGASTLTPTFNSLTSVGTYTFRMTVTDNEGYDDTDDMDVVVNSAALANQAPVANAGGNRSILVPINLVTISGASAEDDDGTIASVSWQKLPGSPAGGNIINSTTITPTFRNLTWGRYTYRLTVTDNDGATDIDDMDVVVDAVATQPVIRDPGDGPIIDPNPTLPTFPITPGPTPSPTPSPIFPTPTPSPTPTLLPDLTASMVSIRTGNANGVDGTYEFSTLLLIGNAGPGALIAASSSPYMSEVDIDFDGSYAADLVSGIAFQPGFIAAGNDSGTFLQSFSPIIPFGTHRACLRVNLDGATIAEAGDVSNNTSCLTQLVPVPNPPMEITASQDLVRAGQSVVISWSAHTSYPVNCEVYGAGSINTTPGARFDSSTNMTSPVTGTATISALNNTSEFILQCIEPSTNTPFTESIIVEVVPNFEEF